MPPRRRRERPVRSKTEKPNVVPAGMLGGQYRPLKEGDVKRIHEASLSVLERTGIQVVASEAREIFRKAGARIDEENDRVFIPPSMVEDALETGTK